MDNLCEGCNGTCCRYISFPLKNRMDVAFSKARGFKIVDGIIFIPHVCPKLDKDGKCSIYEERPLNCRIFKPNCDVCRAVRKIKDEV